MAADQGAARGSRFHRLWRAINPDLRGELARLDDEKLARLYDGILRSPFGLKGVHIRMVRDELARRGL